MKRLGVNIDHVATLREARGTAYPSPLKAAEMALQAGADGITVHLREDRRHIQDEDVVALVKRDLRLNLEMALTDEMITLASQWRPSACCLVPEKRQELTTEGGLQVAGAVDRIKPACVQLTQAGIEVSLFIDPNVEQSKPPHACAVPVIELHTGAYAERQVLGKTSY